MIDLDRLNEYQKEAVLHNEGPAIVLANAGSGKTYCVVSRIARLIEEGTAPRNIVAITFTTKAANEMKERIATIIGEGGREVRISTIHSLCNSFLREYDSLFKTVGSYKIMTNTYEVWQVLNKFLKDKKIPFKDLKWYLHMISQSKLSGKDPEEFKREFVDPNFSEENNKYGENIYNNKYIAAYIIFKEYENFLRRRKLRDFDDLLFHSYRILKEPKSEKVEKFIKSFTRSMIHLIVDEFQDTNSIAFYICSRFIENTNNIYVVGDPKQSIYGFMGAKDKVIKEYIEKYSPKIYTLPINYRSTPTIVENSNRLIENSTTIEHKVPSVSHREEEGFVKTLSSFTELDEAENITKAINDVMKNGETRYGDIAILYRVNSQSMPFIDSFIDSGIPFQVHSSTSLLKNRELRTIITYISLVYDVHQLGSEEFWSIANAPVRYITRKSFDDIEYEQQLGGGSFFEAMKEYSENNDGWEAKNIGSLVNDIENLLATYTRMDLGTQGVIGEVLYTIGLRDWLIGNVEAGNMDLDDHRSDKSKESNMDLLMSISKKYPDIGNFLTFVTAMDKKSSSSKTAKSHPDKVQLMSFHKSKGLEFPIVFMAGVCSRLLPFYKHEGSEGLDEERRLFYVGATRPKDALFISRITERFGIFNVRDSIFLGEYFGKEIPYN